MTSARLLQYKIFLMEQVDLELRSGEGFNQASCLTGPGGRDLDLQTWAREELQGNPCPGGEKVSIDGS